jgi:outer membrane lipoprotein carrier protein
VYHSGALGAEEPENGRLVAAKPGRMRWEYESPEPKMAVVDGEWAWIYYVDEGEIECHHLEGRLDGSPVAALLSGSVDLREEFLIEVGTVQDGQRTVRLRPRELSEDFEEVVLTVREKDLTPRHLEVIDPVGSRQEFRFDNVRVNQGVGVEAFAPRVPRDVVWNGDCPPWRRVGPG